MLLPLVPCSANVCGRHLQLAVRHLLLSVLLLLQVVQFLVAWQCRCRPP
jgi:hypothetical protein